MKRLIALLLVLFMASPTLAATLHSEAHNTVPSSNVSFLTDLQTFLREEDAERFSEMFQGYVVSGGVISTGAGRYGQGFGGGGRGL